MMSTGFDDGLVRRWTCASQERTFHGKNINKLNAWSGTPLDNAPHMLKDLRHGFRVLLQAKGWTAVVVLSLAVGIGANAAVFTAVNGLLLRKLPVTDPDSLVRLRWGGRNDMSNDSSDYGMQRARLGWRAGAGPRSHTRCFSISGPRIRR